MQQDGTLRKRVPSLLPAPPQTGHAQQGCYLSFTQDCSPDLSAEHYISKSVLSVLGDKILVGGASWLAKKEQRSIGINNLKARILCSRHNNALSPLDAEAGKFFQTLYTAFDNLSRKSISTSRRWYLFSGEMLELWMLKTLWGMVRSESAAIDRRPVSGTHRLNANVLYEALKFGVWPENCGLYLLKESSMPVTPRQQVTFQTVSDDNNAEIQGCALTLRGLDFKLVLDPSIATWAETIAPHTCHPEALILKNSQRERTIELTWMPETKGDVVLITAAN